LNRCARELDRLDLSQPHRPEEAASLDELLILMIGDSATVTLEGWGFNRAIPARPVAG
jgi:hypothetical protein